MKRHIRVEIMFVLLASLSFQCELKRDEGVSTYFESGDLSRDLSTDSICSHQFSSALQSLNEKPIRSSKVNFIFRLTVLPSFYNAYCIRIEHVDTVTTVTFKMAADHPKYVRAGLTNLNLEYGSGHDRMDSLFLDLQESVKKYDFYPGFDEADFGAADGTLYLLESSIEGTYNVVRGWNGGEYEGKENLLLISRQMHAFVPAGLVPDLDRVKTFEDLFFSPLRRSSQ